MKGRVDVESVHIELNVAEAKDLLRYIQKHGHHDGTPTGNASVPKIRRFLERVENIR